MNHQRGRFAASAVVGLVLAVLAFALPTPVLAVDPDFTVPGVGTGPTGAESVTVWYGDVRAYDVVTVTAGTLEGSSGATVRWRWVCDGGQFGLQGQAGPVEGGFTLALGNKAGTDLFVTEQIQTSDSGRCAFTVWAVNGALRLSNVTLSFWLNEGAGGPLPTPTPTPTPEPTPSPTPPGPPGEHQLRVDNGQTATETWTAPSDGYMQIRYMKEQVAWGGTSTWHVDMVKVSGSGWGGRMVTIASAGTGVSRTQDLTWEQVGVIPAGWVDPWDASSPCNIGPFRSPWNTGSCHGQVFVPAGTAVRLLGTFGFTGYTFIVRFDFTPTLQGAPEPSPSPSASPSPDPSVDSDGDGFSDQVEAGAGTDPNDPGNYPGGFGGAPPPPPQGGTSSFDVCAAEHEASERAMCEEITTYTMTPGAVDPEGIEALVTALQERAPFGYAAQVAVLLADGVSGAAAGPGNGIGSDAFGCFTMPVWFGPGSTQSYEACVPLQTYADKLAPIRGALLAMLLLAFGAVILRRTADLASA